MKYLFQKRPHHFPYVNFILRELLLFSMLWSFGLYGQTDRPLKKIPLDSFDSIPSFTLQQCIDYALGHQPALQRSLIKESITKLTNAISLAGWLPQVNTVSNLNHYFQLPTNSVASSSGGTAAFQKTGVINTSTLGVNATQAIFTPSLLYAFKTKDIYIDQAREVTDSTKIELVSAVSKSFYALLLTIEQVDVLKQDTMRLSRSMNDAYHQYVGGIVDETNYQQAAIALNNSMAQLKQATGNITAQYAILKQLMGYQPQKQFNISFDSTQMISHIQVDTNKQLDYQKRIEYKQLFTAKHLQRDLTSYYKWSFLPSLGAFYNYNFVFQNDTLPKLFSHVYPNSYIGLTLSVPIFTGFARIHNLRKSKLQEKLLDWGEVDLKSIIYTQYTSALATYKSNLYSLDLLKKNEAMASRVYFIVNLQYREGIVPYLNVITAEANLITSQINYLNALFQVLSSKIDLEKAMGEIRY